MARGPSVLPEFWNRSPEDRRRRRVITIDLEDPRFDPVFRYANAVAPDRSVQESIRDLLLQAVSDDPMTAAIREARRQAFKEVKKRALEEVGQAMKQIGQALELEPADAEEGLPPPTNAILDPDPDPIFR